MSFQKYLQYRQMELEFYDKRELNQPHIFGEQQFIQNMRNLQRRELLRSARNISLVALIAFTAPKAYVAWEHSEQQYAIALNQAAKVADLNNDGKVEGAKELAAFFSSLPKEAKYFLRL